MRGLDAESNVKDAEEVGPRKVWQPCDIYAPSEARALEGSSGGCMRRQGL